MVENLFSKKDLKRLILPLVAEQFLAMTIGACDTVMVSSVGEAGVSVVSLIDQLTQLFIQLFAAFANKEPEQRGSFERKGIADRIVESTTAKMTPVFTEPEHKIDNIHIENGVYRIHEEKDAASNVKINYDFKRLVDSVLNG